METKMNLLFQKTKLMFEIKFIIIFRKWEYILYCSVYNKFNFFM